VKGAALIVTSQCNPPSVNQPGEGYISLTQTAEDNGTMSTRQGRQRRQEHFRALGDYGLRIGNSDYCTDHSTEACPKFGGEDKKENRGQRTAMNTETF
jgi:hypothetical protein